MTITRDHLLSQLAKQEKRLAELELRQEEARRIREAIRDQLARLPAPTAELECLSVVSEQSVPAKPAEKVRLFRSLFRGREDVFPRAL